MAVPITVPKATLALEEANILKWLKAEGASVARDEAVFEMETDKVVVEVPAPADGILLRIQVREGPVRVGQVVGWLGQAGEQPEPSAEPGRAGGRREAAPPTPAASSDFLAATPAARRRARELGVDLKAVKGTGPGGRITQEDVEKWKS